MCTRCEIQLDGPSFYHLLRRCIGNNLSRPTLEVNTDYSTNFGSWGPPVFTPSQMTVDERRVVTSGKSDDNKSHTASVVRLTDDIP